MKLQKITFTILAIFLFSISAIGQDLYISGQFGYSSPKGDAFKDEAGEKLSSFGIGYDMDVMLILPVLDKKLSAGITYDGNALFGKESEEFADIGIYGLSLYGIKGQYRLLEPDKKFSPYGSLSMGLSQFSTPDITSGNDVVVKGESAFSFGLRPEIGLDLYGLLISASYFVPMQYKVDSDTGAFDGSAGTFSIFIGYRHSLDFSSY